MRSKHRWRGKLSELLGRTCDRSEALWEPRVQGTGWQLGGCREHRTGPEHWPCLSPATRARKGRCCTPPSGNLGIKLPITRSDYSWWGSSGKEPGEWEP